MAGLGDHVALDFLNTVEKVDGVLVDRLASEGDVARWLVGAGMLDAGRVKVPGLLESARRLREVVRVAVERRKDGRAVDVKGLNEFLKASKSHLEMNSSRAGIGVVRRWGSGSAEEVLGPLAEAAAELLAEGDFELVRKCEDAECVLWFYDRTKSHHRRWCSMAGCGNRNKVAAYRRRRAEG